MDGKAEIEVIRKVWDALDPVGLTVRWGEDGFGVCLLSDDAKTEEWFGKVRLTFSASYAIELGRALIAAGEEGKARGQ